MRGGRRVPGGRRGCRVGHNVPEIKGEAAGLVGRPGQRHFQTARLSGVSQGVQSRRRLWSRSHPVGAPISPAPGLASFAYVSTVFVFTFSTLVFPFMAQSARGSVIPPFQRAGKG